MVQDIKTLRDHGNLREHFSIVTAGKMSDAIDALSALSLHTSTAGQSFAVPEQQQQPVQASAALQRPPCLLLQMHRQQLLLHSPHRALCIAH